jgi:hypothetical protein
MQRVLVAVADTPAPSRAARAAIDAALLGAEVRAVRVLQDGDISTPGRGQWRWNSRRKRLRTPDAGGGDGGRTGCCGSGAWGARAGWGSAVWVSRSWAK